MPNIQNLVQYKVRTQEERSEQARKAGIASGKARAKNKTLFLKLNKAINNASKYTKLRIYEVLRDIL